MASQNNDAQNLQIRLTAQAQAAMQTFVKLKNEIIKTNKGLSDMGMQITKVRTKVGKGGLSEVTTEMSKVKETTKGASKEMKNFANFGGGLGGMMLGLFTLRGIRDVLGKSFKTISDYAENFNLFNVSMGDLKDRGVEFQRSLTTAFNVDMSGTLRYQGFFKNMLSSLNIGTEQAYEMSEALTTLTYDMASLFNWSYDAAYTRLQAGIIGQTKPLRAAGIDVTQQTIQPILYELDIHKKVIQLTQAEKVMLRYIAIVRQAGNAHGDYARTIESPSNQVKIFKDQVAILQRWLGATFIGMISKILPFINGFIMAITEVVRAIAILFGFNEEDFGDFGQGDGLDFMNDLEDGADGASEAIGKLQGSLRKFDEINNISMRTGTGGVGGAGSLDTQSKLMKEISAINDKLKQDFANMKSNAEKIRDTLKGWLGIFFELDKETNTFTGRLTIIGGLLLTIGGYFLFKGALTTITTISTGVGTLATKLGLGGGGLALGATLAKVAVGLLAVAIGGLIIWGVTSYFDGLQEKFERRDDMTKFELKLLDVAKGFREFKEDMSKSWELIKNGWSNFENTGFGKFLSWMASKLSFIFKPFQEIIDFFTKPISTKGMPYVTEASYRYEQNKSMIESGNQKYFWDLQGVDLKHANIVPQVVVNIDGEKIATSVVKNINSVTNKSGQTIYNW